MSVDMSLSFSHLKKNLHLRVHLFVVKAEIEELRSLGFNPSGLLFGQSLVLCAFHFASWFCLVFLFIRSVCLSLKGTIQSVKKFQFHR